MYLYRILPFHRLVEVFETGSLYFSSPTTWPDPYEETLAGELAHSVFAQCWCKLGVSDAMWRIYSPDRLSVRIKTTSDTLTQQVRHGLSGHDGRYRVRRRPIEYMLIGDIRAAIKDAQSGWGEASRVSRTLAPFFIKRKAFKHESEYRIVVYDQEAEGQKDGLYVPVKPHSLISSVLADPVLLMRWLRCLGSSLSKS
jgi:hypothetical protein